MVRCLEHLAGTAFPVLEAEQEYKQLCMIIDRGI